MTTEINSQTLVTDAQLAAIVGVEPRQIRRYAEAGTIERDGRNKYNLAEAVQALMAEAAGSGSALTKARTRKVEAEATMAEIELAKSRGEVASITAFHAVQAHTATLIRTGMLNIPQRVVSQIVGSTDEAHIKTALRKEVVLALQSAKQAIESTTADDLERPTNEE